MSTRSHPVWPALVVLAGYLIADLFLSGITAALFVAGLGVVEFLILLVIARITMPSLIAEGAVLGGIGYAGEMIGSPGAGFVLLELTAAVVFLGSVILGKPYLDRQVRSLTGSGMNRSLAGRMTLVLGCVFLTHGTVLLVMMLGAGVRTLPAIVSFGVLYLAAMLVLRGKGRREAVRSLPILAASDDGSFTLVLDGSLLGTMTLEGDRITEVTMLSLTEGILPADFLQALETALAIRGTRTVRFVGWTGDTEPLEIRGYASVSEHWQRILPAFR